MLDKKFKIDSITSYVTQAATVISSLVFMFVVTQYSGVGTFGKVAILLAISGIVSNVMSFRTSEGVVYFVCKDRESGYTLNYARQTIVQGILLDAIMGTIVIIVLTNFSAIISNEFLKDISDAKNVELYAWVFFGLFLRGTGFGVLQASQKFLYINLIKLVEISGKTILIIYFSKTQELTLYQIIISILIPTIIATFIAFIYLIYFYLYEINSNNYNFKKEILKDFLNFSGKTFLSSTLKAGNKNIDVLTLGFLLDPKTVGVYSIFRQFLAPIPFLSTPLSALSYPRFIMILSGERFCELKEIIKGINKKLLYAYILITIVTSVALYIYLYTSRLEILILDYIAYLILIIGYILSSQLWWARSFSNSTDPSISIFANLYASVILITLIFPLVSRYGLLGCALAWTSMNIFLHYYWTRMLEKKING